MLRANVPPVGYKKADEFRAYFSVKLETADSLNFFPSSIGNWESVVGEGRMMDGL